MVRVSSAKVEIDGGHSIQCCAIADDMLVGVATLLLYRNDDDPTEGWVCGVWVNAEHRGQGIAREMLLALHREAENAGCTRLGLQVQKDNLPAQKLYSNLGYIGYEEADDDGLESWGYWFNRPTPEFLFNTDEEYQTTIIQP